MMRVSPFLTFLAYAFACAPLHAEAESPPTYPDFTFKRVSVPQAGQGPKISVQIDPVEQAAFIASRPKPGAQRFDPTAEPVIAAQPAAARITAKSGWEWFWDEVSPALDTAGCRQVGDLSFRPHHHGSTDAAEPVGDHGA